jgi:hypothetical protein
MLGGAMSEVAVTATAFGDRSAPFHVERRRQLDRSGLDRRQRPLGREVISEVEGFSGAGGTGR